MTVKELIKKLKDFPLDLEVVIEDNSEMTQKPLYSIEPSFKIHTKNKKVIALI